jgi:hypothetical protein
MLNGDIPVQADALIPAPRCPDGLVGAIIIQIYTIGGPLKNGIVIEGDHVSPVLSGVVFVVPVPVIPEDQVEVMPGRWSERGNVDPQGEAAP